MYQNRRRYVEALPTLVEIFNKVYHCSASRQRVGFQLSRDMESPVWEGLYQRQDARLIQIQSVGQGSYFKKESKATIEEGYVPNWYIGYMVHWYMV